MLSSIIVCFYSEFSVLLSLKKKKKKSQSPPRLHFEMGEVVIRILSSILKIIWQIFVELFSR